MSSLKEIREAKGMSKQDLANLMRVTRRTIQNWENGRKIPKSMKAYLEKELGVVLDDDTSADTSSDTSTTFIADGNNNTQVAGNGNNVVTSSKNPSDLVEKLVSENIELRKELSKQMQASNENISRLISLLEAERGINNSTTEN